MSSFGMIIISKASLIFLFLFPFLLKHGKALIPVKVGYDCQNKTIIDSYTGTQASIGELLSDLTAHSSSNTFYSSSSGKGDYKLYGQFYCTGNVGPQDCQTCVQTAADTLQLYCHFYSSAVIIYKDCTLRYSNNTIYGVADYNSIGYWYYTSTTVPYIGFNQTVYSTLDKVMTQAAFDASSKGFATGVSSLSGTSQSLNVLAQCTPDVLGSPCQACLQEALKSMSECCPNSLIHGIERTFLYYFLPSCQLGFEVKYSSRNDGSPSYYSGMNVLYMMLTLAVAALISSH